MSRRLFVTYQRAFLQSAVLTAIEYLSRSQISSSRKLSSSPKSGVVSHSRSRVLHHALVRGAVLPDIADTSKGVQVALLGTVIDVAVAALEASSTAASFLGGKRGVAGGARFTSEELGSGTTV